MTATVTQLRTRKPTGLTAWPRILVSGPGGSGKAQPLHSRLATPTGWTTMGEVEVGDQLIGSDGGPISVTAVHERGELPIYRLTFSDGSSAEACDDHLWASWTSGQRHRKWKTGPLKGQPRRYPGTVRTTSDIRQLLLAPQPRSDRQTAACFIPVAAPVRYAPQAGPLPIDPYALGLMLGDGGMTKSTAPTFTSCDQELFEALEQLIPYGDYLTRAKGAPTVYVVGGNLVRALKTLGLMGLKSERKHIPEQYLTASISDRLSLLQGLMDTDGTLARQGAGGGGASIFSTSSPFLARDVRQLVESLGGTAATRTKQTTHLPSHNLNIRLRKGVCPFRLTRKAQAFGETRTPRFYPPARHVEQVDYVGVMPARCITVSAEDSLYLTDNFIVTHNSWQLAELSASERIGRTLWLELAERTADEYGQVPGARYELIDHDGTYQDIIAQLEAAVVAAKVARADGDKPWVLGVDTMTAYWDMLKSWADGRARKQAGNAAKLRSDPNAEIKVSLNIWQDVDKRWRKFMTLLLTFPGPVVMLAKGKHVIAIDDDGKPIANAPKVYKVEAKNGLEYDASQVIRLSTEEGPVVTKCRSVHHGVRPGIDDPVPLPDFSLAWFIFDLLKIDPKTAAVADIKELDGGGLTKEEAAAPDPEVQHPPKEAPRKWGSERQAAQPRPATTHLSRDDAAAKGITALLAVGDEVQAAVLMDVASKSPARAVDTSGGMSIEAKAELKIAKGDKVTLEQLAEKVHAYVVENGFSVNNGIAQAAAEAAERSAPSGQAVSNEDLPDDMRVA